jgi:transposase
MAEHTEYNARERRRLRAWELKKQGWKQKDIAEALGVSKGAVSQWMKRVRKYRMQYNGKEAKEQAAKRALLCKPPGRRPNKRIEGEYLKYASKNRLPAKDVTRHIARYFRVHYHPDHVSRLMRKMRDNDYRL